MTKLKRIKLTGFKSIREMDLEMRNLNVLIGANGAGKSNLVSFFKLLRDAMVVPRLQEFVARAGGANALLHYGAATTQEIAAHLEFDVAEGVASYALRLAYAAPDSLVVADERLLFPPHQEYSSLDVEGLGGGYNHIRPAQGGLQNSLLDAIYAARASGDPRAKNASDAVFSVLAASVLHLHDTSETAQVRQNHYINDGHYLQPDAGNLSAYLYALQETRPEYYRRIVGTIRQVAPFFEDFVLAPTPLNANMIRLDWRERDRDMVFGPHQLSDGTLRAMALITLLLQPEDTLPQFLIIDEPELGLHPYALSAIAGLIRAAALDRQVVVCTQSARLVDEFEPEDIVVVDKIGGESKFTRPNPARLAEWLEEYSLGELWEKNVLGGRPAW